jgi:uncharacterized protein YbjT (DUF2867 family)
MHCLDLNWPAAVREERIMIVIFGATGNTGGKAAQLLLGDGSQVRVVGRRRERLSDLVKLGAEAVQADLENLADVKRALVGADAAYLLIPPNLTVTDFRAYQRRVSDNLTNAVRQSGCRKVVLLSSMGADHASGTGPIVGLHELETQLRQIAGLDVLAIRAGYFMENLLGNIGMVRSMGIFGAPALAEAQLGLIAAADIGRYAAARLSKLDFSGFEVVNLIGPSMLSFAEVTRSIGTAIGKPELPFVQFSYEDAKHGMVANGLPIQMAELFVALYQGAAAGLLNPEPGTPVVSTMTAFSEFAQTFAALYRRESAA